MKVFKLGLLSLLSIILLAALAAFCGCKEKATTYTIEYIAQEGGKIEGEAAQQIEAGNNTVLVTAVPDEGYTFVRWSDGREFPERYDKNITADKTYTAIFKKVAYSITYSSEQHGKIVGDLHQTLYAGESGTEVVAVPDEGYAFVHWSDGNISPDRCDTNIKADKTYTAIFKKVAFFITYSSGHHGKIIGDLHQILNAGESGTKVVAVPDEGYKFVKWSDWNYSAERQDLNVKSDKNITAIFEKQTFTVEYCSNNNHYGGVYYLSGQRLQVPYGENGSIVEARPLSNYIFLGWSDGVTTAVRQEKDVKEDITITAYFGSSVTYTVYNGKGGKIEGNLYQEAVVGEKYSAVTAVPDDGFVFCGWSDLSFAAQRQDEAQDGAHGYNFTIAACFEPVEKTFYYDYGDEYGAPSVSKIKLNRNNLKNAVFAVPNMTGYKFGGWYADKDYKIKVADGDGRLILGTGAFTIDSVVLYAKWEKTDGQSLPVHKIMLVNVEKVQASLYSTRTESNVDVNYQMSGIERILCMAVRDKMSYYLNLWFDGIAEFEVDSYFTQETVESESFTGGLNIGGDVDYDLYAKNMPEVSGLSAKYHNVLTILGMGNYDFTLSSGDGVAGKKYGCIYLDKNLWIHKTKNNIYGYVNNLKSGNGYNDGFVNTLLHEFCHTCEDACLEYVKTEYHDFLQYMMKKMGLDFDYFDVTRMYLLGEAEYNGETCGIISDYWQHNLPIHCNYITNRVDGIKPGKVVQLLDGDEITTEYGSVVAFPEYGGTLTVKAIPEDGYEFVKWSDEVKTAERRDAEIISYLVVTAIFKKV